MMIGTGGIKAPTKDCTDLYSRVGKTAVSKQIDNKTIVLTGTFDDKRINKINEIGIATTNDQLISKDCFDDVTIPQNSTLTIVYKFTLGLGTIKTNWLKLNGYNFIYQTTDNQEVKGVEETDTLCGYINFDNKDDVNKTQGSFFYDNGFLYIHTTDDASLNELS